MSKRTSKPPTSFRLDEESLAALATLASLDGVSRTDALRIALREALRKRKVQKPTQGVNT